MSQTPDALSVRLLDVDHDRTAWIRVVGRSPQATPFHHPAWSRTLSDCYGFRAFLAVVERGGQTEMALPIIETRAFGKRRWVSLPFTDHCPPLLGEPDMAPAALAALDRTRRSAGATRLELRSPVPGRSDLSYLAAVRHVLPLEPDPDAVLGRASKSQVRRNIARARREGVVVRRGRSQIDLTGHYYDLHVDTRRRQGVPAQPKNLFRHLWRNVMEPGLGCVLLAYAGTTPVAGAVFLSWNGTTIYKYGASDPRRWSLRANALIFGEAIRSACLAGDHDFDFGRTDLDNTGLRDFKHRWGSEELPLRYSTVPYHQAGSGAGRAERVCAAMLRRGPRWVCRASGQLLYRYAA